MSREFELSRRKILGAVGGVGLASAGAGMGTSAFFSDTESFENNSMTAGELDLRIDWQQQYYGPTESWEFVNAHPDHDSDGEQSLDLSDIDGEDLTGEFDGVTSSDPVVEYSELGANIQEYLTCATLEHDYDYNGQTSLIELDDVKPGDKGEITFSYHLCDNPGYVWLLGELTENAENGVVEPEEGADGEDGTQADPGTDGELAHKLEAFVWYDLDCDNKYDDDGESIIFEWGSLSSVMSDLSADGGVRLDPVKYPGHSVDSGELDENNDYGCPTLGKIEWDEGEFVAVEENKSDSPFFPGGSDVSGSYPAYDQAFEFDGTGIVIGVDYVLDDDDGAPAFADLDVIDGVAANDGTGLCLIDVFGANNHTLFGGACTREIDDLFVYKGTDGEFAGGLDPEEYGKHAISHIRLYYCPDDGGAGGQDEPLCFEGDRTYCLGFQWVLPSSVGNEVQTDSVSFDLGFYTEQCRHNGNPTGPGSS
jgi:predicted ribosomally synthesized peptide with SipW-like signal peptide